MARPPSVWARQKGVKVTSRVEAPMDATLKAWHPWQGLAWRPQAPTRRICPPQGVEYPQIHAEIAQWQLMPDVARAKARYGSAHRYAEALVVDVITALDTRSKLARSGPPCAPSSAPDQ
jgi:hypothetical protein